MQFELVPLLEIQRELYAMPRGGDRFKHYIATLTGGGDDIDLLPLGALNPMAKPHVAAYVEALIDLRGEDVVAEALNKAAARLSGAGGRLKVGLAVADDAQGGWTNRFFSEAGMRFDLKAALARGWASVVCWSSEPPTAAGIYAETLASAYRSAYVAAHGPAATLAQRMRQEGAASLFAHASGPALDEDELAYTREVIAPYRDSDAYPAIMACLYGDEAAASLGYPTLGLSPRAGYAVALAEARQRGDEPEALL
ncbi:MAG TPA: hypothetical protein VD886_22575 [Herpetosiphonaceae bacterium]|nr:hypothetical protein [Herpetosiphonaceae bacterium]